MSTSVEDKEKFIEERVKQLVPHHLTGTFADYIARLEWRIFELEWRLEALEAAK